MAFASCNSGSLFVTPPGLGATDPMSDVASDNVFGYFSGLHLETEVNRDKLSEGSG